ncbi:MAG: MerC domain-containing protein [Oligoflexales bacterium]|nr:MerC domain-containing protein [Oligoflexales bacterium]
MESFSKFGDKMAIGLSIACTIHCLAMPALLVLAPSLSAFSILDDCAFHQWMMVGVLPTSIYALSMGCKNHRNLPILATGILGISILFVTAFWGHDLFGCKGEKYMTLLGSCVISCAHFLNYRRCQVKSCSS